MADFVKNLFGGQKPVQAPVVGDDDFADYAGAPDPTPAAISSFTDAAHMAQPTGAIGGARPYTAWYRVWERTSAEDFKLEMYILPFLFLLIATHVWGTRANRSKARAWAKAHAPSLQQEFAQVGYKAGEVSDDILKEKKADEHQSYATGRQNVAFIDFKISLVKRYNPFMLLGEYLIPLFFESFPAPTERVEATAYVFDGNEAKHAPNYGSGDAKKVPNSSFDGFVFAVVHKDIMKRMREDRYDVSLTTTRDHAKLPIWTAVMSESAEITDLVLAPELIKAIHDAGDNFEALIITDQPIDQPKTLDDTKPKKRINLSLKLASDYTSTMPLFNYFLRLPDHLATAAHFRPEALRRIKQTRDEQIAKIRKVDEEEKAEERKIAADKLKREQRDAKLGRLSADEQRKYLEKEREKDSRKKMKRSTVKA
ncbi:hypothetical protein HBI56_026170 [Parastagonospora nodorum]|uniref:DUF1682 domain protein n=1 Tax=Phaeosphaeria nodorum (strain SN15 / ATCC MYA-4574 / FGSC 10173) TaxID=321614 RepID=A0A7U2F1L4_PHANO|nr:hypothetical protein HBH56_013830 [Parastagonospora nodorum]QRC94894.1 hypothetical protein JI435_026410 [Parastagonospora nodorum SN15]KAH3937552.1 hypothetical protein HBH54_020630 [Parastagonospora nodorum]KAH3953420.1 hypothetical protein HBH53_033030 [Parastagonospora nodorum]KAH3969386.1 hypothetical protein HBH51_125190 [Parastagonospora nodorum]